MNESSQRAYNLETRTIDFSRTLVRFCKNVEYSSVTNPLVVQLVRAGTSIGANYQEANGASSKRDFKNKIHICKKEAQETKYWLRLLSDVIPGKEDEVKALWGEANEFSMIFGKIITTMNEKSPIREA